MLATKEYEGSVDLVGFWSAIFTKLAIVLWALIAAKLLKHIA
jgi:hypothetical protein